MADIRQRKTPAATSASSGSTSKHVDASDKDQPSGIKLTDILRILGGIALLNTALSYYITGDSFAWGYRPWFSKPGQFKQWLNGPLLLTDEELKAYDGSDTTKPIYLALNGTIYDVSAGRNYYGPGGMYGFFSGHDAARAFITGCFQEDITPDMRGIEEMYVPREDEEADTKLSKGELKTRRERELRLGRKKVADGIEGWHKVFRGDTGKNYFKVGEVKREEGWLEKMPRRELCESAQKKRRKRKAGE